MGPRYVLSTSSSAFARWPTLVQCRGINIGPLLIPWGKQALWQQCLSLWAECLYHPGFNALQFLQYLSCTTHVSVRSKSWSSTHSQSQKLRFGKLCLLFRDPDMNTHTCSDTRDSDMNLWWLTCFNSTSGKYAIDNKVPVLVSWRRLTQRWLYVMCSSFHTWFKKSSFYRGDPACDWW